MNAKPGRMAKTTVVPAMRGTAKSTKQAIAHPVETPLPARERVYQFVRRSILVGEYPGGTFIEEEDISRRTGVSRTPVREAFHRLHAEQYIDLLPRKGALVRQVSSKELLGLFQARLLLEGGAMELICRERIPISPKIAAILESMRDMKDASTPSEQLEFIGLDWSLHCAIFEMCDNEVLVELYKSLRSRYDRVVRTIKITPERVRRVYAEHIKLLGLLQAYDIEGLRALLQEHLTVS